MNYRKLFIGLAVVALIFGVSAVSAKAQTIDELLAQIALLQQQLQQLQGGGGGGGSAPMPPLTVGSTGEGVRALQQWLNGHGYTVAASGPGSPGMESTYFGALTQAALARFQAASGISPAAGYYGNITYNFILSMGGGGGGGGSDKPQCSDGIDNDNDGKIDGFDSDCSDPNDNSESAGGGGGQSDGKLTTVAVTLESSPADGTDLASDYTGVTLLKEKIRVSNSPGILKQVGFQTTHRAWLYWLNAYLYVGDTMVAEKKGLTSANFSEVTVGSKYNLTFDNLNYALPVDADTYMTLRVDAVSDTGRTATNGLIIQQDTNQVIVLDANDNYSVAAGFGTGTSNDRTYDWITASSGTILPSTNTASPGTRWVRVSEAGPTQNVTTHVFNVKAEQKEVELNTVTVSASTSGKTLTTLISDWNLYEGSCPTDGNTDGCTSLAGGSVSGSAVTFSNLNVRIPVNTTKTFTVKAQFADEDDFTADGTTAASTTVMANLTGFAGVDIPTYNSLTEATILGSNVTGGDMHSILVAPTISSQSFTVTDDSAYEYLKHLTAAFTLRAEGGALYVSANNHVALATSTTASSTANGSAGVGLTALNVSSCANCGDTANRTPSPPTGYYVIPDGTSRTFTYTGSLSNLLGTAGTKNFKTTKIFFSDDSSDLDKFHFDTTFPGMSILDKDFYMNNVDVTQ